MNTSRGDKRGISMTDKDKGQKESFKTTEQIQALFEMNNYGDEDNSKDLWISKELHDQEIEKWSDENKRLINLWKDEVNQINLAGNKIIAEKDTKIKELEEDRNNWSKKYKLLQSKLRG